MRKFNTICPLVLIILFLIFPSSYAQSDSTNKVLLINSYHKGFPWTDNIVSGIESVFISESSNIELTVEYMDTKSIGYDAEYMKILFNSYHYKYLNHGFDLIMVSDDNAFNFIKEYKEELFPNIPVIFCGLNNANAPKLVDPYTFTGILETLSHEDTIDLILDLHRETKKIMLVVDKTPSGKYRWSQIEPSLSRYTNIEFSRISDDYYISEIENMLKGLNNDTVVIFFTLYRDKSGDYLSLKEGVSRITTASTRPVYTTHLLEFPYGVLGGKVLGGFYHGVSVANIVLRILNGEDVSSISFIETSPTQYMFNYPQLKKWGIKLSDLPKNSVILDKPISIYDKYKYQVWGILGIIIALFAIIFVLQANSRKRKYVEKALIKSQRLLTETEKLGKVGGWEIDSKTLKMIWTEETYAIHELEDLSEVTVETSINFYTAESKPIIEQAVRRAIENGEQFDVELEIITCKGNARFVHAIGKPDPINHRIYGFFQDITDRKHVENELQETKEDFRAIAENTTDYVMRYDINGRHLFGNNATLKAMGVTLSELIGKTHRELGFPEDICDLWLEKILLVFNTGLHQQFEITVELISGIKTLALSLDPEFGSGGNVASVLGISRDITDFQLAQEENRSLAKFPSENPNPVLRISNNGIILYANIAAATILKSWGLSLDESVSGKWKTILSEAILNKEVITVEENIYDKMFLFSAMPVIDEYYVNLYARDITEQHLAEESARINENYYKNIINKMGDPVFVKDDQSRILLVNDAFCKIFDLPRENIIGKTLAEKVPPKEWDEFMKIDKQVLLDGKDNINDETLTVRNGETLKISTRKTRFRDHNDKKFLVGVIRDITKQFKMEEQLRQSQKMEAIGQLAGGVAHDFNNMLSGIMGCAQLLSRKVSEDNKLSRYTDLIMDASMQAAELTQKLLTFSHKVKIEKEKFDIHDCILKIYSMLQRSIDKRIVIHTKTKAKNSMIHGDKSQILNAFLNIGINSRDAMPTGGELSFTTKNLYLDETDLSTELDLKPGLYIEIDVEDTGSGMTKEVQERLFEPFFTTKEMGKGTGLGLSVVYNTIKENLGHINVYSEVNQGSVFKIFLPVLPDKVSKNKKEKDQLLLGSGTVLLVDDESSILFAVGEMLREFGYKVLTASEGEECIKIYKEKGTNIDLVILDMVMPKKNGRDVFYEMKAINPNAKVLISSGYSKDISIDKLIEDGVVGFIKKPYTQFELSKKVSEVLLQVDDSKKNQSNPNDL